MSSGSLKEIANIYGGKSISESIMSCINLFIVWNISTITLIAIYFICRAKIKKNKEIDKMNIQDLH